MFYRNWEKTRGSDGNVLPQTGWSGHEWTHGLGFEFIFMSLWEYWMLWLIKDAFSYVFLTSILTSQLPKRDFCNANTLMQLIGMFMILKSLNVCQCCRPREPTHPRIPSFRPNWLPERSTTSDIPGGLINLTQTRQTSSYCGAFTGRLWKGTLLHWRLGVPGTEILVFMCNPSTFPACVRVSLCIVYMCKDPFSKTSLTLQHNDCSWTLPTSPY